MNRANTPNRRNRGLAILCLAIFLVPHVADAQLLWRSDPARGFDVFEGLEDWTGTGSIDPDPTGQHGDVYHMHVVDADGKDRVEVKGFRVDGANLRLAYGEEYYLGWRSMWQNIEPDPPRNWIAFFQIHGYGGDGCGAPLVLRTVGDGQLHLQYDPPFPNTPSVHIWSIPFEPGGWHSYVLRFRTTTNEADAHLQLWYDGVPQTFINGSTAYPALVWDKPQCGYIRQKWGLYRSGSHRGGGGDAYLVDARLARTYEEAAPPGSGGGGGGDPTPTPTRLPTPTPTPTPLPGLRYEAELVPRASFGATTAEQSDARNSRGKWMALLADGPGDSVEYTLANVPAGTYDLLMKYKSHPNRGILTMQLDDQPIGPAALDQYSNPPAYPEIPLATVRFASDGDHVVRQTVLDKNPAAGAYTASADLFILLRDETPPEIEVSDDITVEATGPSGAAVPFAVSAIDEKDGPVPVTVTPPSGSVFPLGETTVEAVAVDFGGNRATERFRVTVEDTTPPAISLPADIVAEATSASGAVVAFEAAAHDLVSGRVAVALSPPSGRTFALGQTSVTATAVDSAGNVGTRTFRVTVADRTPPVLTVPPGLTIGTCAQPNIGQATATDSVGVPAVTNDAPALFALGTTYVTWRAVDPSGNESRGVQRVIVELGDDASCCPAGTKVRVGTADTDVLLGTEGSDCLLGRGGNDVIDARGGNDFVTGGAGRDTIAGGFGDDLIDGGPGDDIIDAGPGDDVVKGRGGRDTIASGTGSDTVDGGADTDVCAIAPDARDSVVGCP